MRGNNEDFIWFLENNFEFFIDNIEKENVEGVKIRLENEGDFILNDQLFDNLIKQIIKNNEENNK